MLPTAHKSMQALHQACTRAQQSLWLLAHCSHTTGAGGTQRAVHAASSRQWQPVAEPFAAEDDSSGPARQRAAASTTKYREPSRTGQHAQHGQPRRWQPVKDQAVQDVQALPHRRRAAARKAEAAAAGKGVGAVAVATAPAAAAAAASASEPYPTFVPRNPGITDGAWNEADKRILQVALTDAAEAVTPTKVDAAGFVLLGKSLEEVEALVASLGQPKYRAKQLQDGVLQGARSLDDISNIPKQLKAALTAAGVRTGRSILHKQVTAPDGTAKFLLQLSDGRVVETVGIPNDEEPTVDATQEEGAGPGQATARRKGSSRLTVCVSSQVGCPMRCSFCATGKGGFARNLSPHEIMDQVLTVREAFGRRVSNVVFMGMGEPLLNLPSVVAAYKLLNTQLGISGRAITVSTVGVPNAIPRLARAEIRSTLAVSIHAPNQQLRESIIPSAKAYPIEALVKDCTTYFKITGRRVTFEYTLLSGVNDAVEHAQELAALLRAHDLLSHVNVIPWNPVDESEFARPSRNRVFNFVRALEAAGLTTTVRITRGLEAAAACGQLRNMHQKEPLPAFAVPS